MKHPERVHSRSQLLDKVWGDHVFIEERTVDVHVKRLRESLGAAGAMIETVRGAGYRLSPHSAATTGPAPTGWPRRRRAARVTITDGLALPQFPALPSWPAASLGWWLGHDRGAAVGLVAGALVLAGRGQRARCGACSGGCGAAIHGAALGARALGRGGRARAAHLRHARAGAGRSRGSAACRSSWRRSRLRRTAWSCSTPRAASNGATRRRPASSGFDLRARPDAAGDQPGARPLVHRLLQQRHACEPGDRHCRPGQRRRRGRSSCRCTCIPTAKGARCCCRATSRRWSRPK